MSRKLLPIGAAMLVAGAMLLVISFGPSGSVPTASAGEGDFCVTFTPTRTPSRTPTSGPTNTPTNTPTTAPTNTPTATSTTAIGQVQAFDATPQRTCEATNTPTSTSTTAPTTSTPIPPTATRTPTGGAGGQPLRPPDTGSGDVAGGSSTWILAAGIVAMLAGGGVLLAGAKARR